MEHTRSGSLARDVAAATAAVVVLYGLARVQFPPFQIPGYLLVVGFDAIEAVLGSAGDAYRVLFGAYLLGLGVAGGTVAHYVRRWSAGTDLPSWRVGLAGGLAVIGTGALAFAAVVASALSQPTPVLITGTTGVVLLMLAGWLLGLLDDLREHAGR